MRLVALLAGVGLVLVAIPGVAADQRVFVYCDGNVPATSPGACGVSYDNRSDSCYSLGLGIGGPCASTGDSVGVGWWVSGASGPALCSEPKYCHNVHIQRDGCGWTAVVEQPGPEKIQHCVSDRIV